MNRLFVVESKLSETSVGILFFPGTRERNTKEKTKEGRTGRAPGHYKSPK